MENSLFKNKNIYIALTYNCNAKCQKCMTRYHVNREHEMSKKLIDIICSKLYKANYQGMISVGSGEPILYPHMEYFVEKILSINDKVHLRLLTNGQAFTNKLPTSFFDKRCKWGVTLDGFIQSDLCELQKGISIETVKQNIKTIVEMYGSRCLYLNFTLNNQNYKHLTDYCKFAVSLGISEVYVTELKIYEGYDGVLGNYRLQRNADIYKILSKAVRILSDRGIPSSSFDIDLQNKKDRCFLTNRASPIIDVNGVVSFCSGHEDTYIGNIQDFDIEDKWKSFAEQLISKNISWCKHCHDRILPNGMYSLPKTIKYTF